MLGHQSQQEKQYLRKILSVLYLPVLSMHLTTAHIHLRANFCLMLKALPSLQQIVC